MVATISANQSVEYSKVYYGHSFEEWVDIIHKENCNMNNWKYTKLQHGSFGFDNIVISLYYLFENANASELVNDNIEHLAHLIHEGWIVNYTYWRDNSPWLQNEDYIRPYSPLGDQRRNDCASTKYADLPEEEKEKDRILVRTILMNLIISQ